LLQHVTSQTGHHHSSSRILGGKWQDHIVFTSKIELKMAKQGDLWCMEAGVVVMSVVIIILEKRCHHMGGIISVCSEQ
jgi:hypothetical protein